MTERESRVYTFKNTFTKSAIEQKGGISQTLTGEPIQGDLFCDQFAALQMMKQYTLFPCNHK
jgi:hypothetical protein